MKAEYPLGGFNQDYNSRESRTRAINALIEQNNTGNFSRVRRAPGLVSKYSVGLGPIRGMFEIQDELFVVSRNKLYKIDATETVTELGDVGGLTTPVYMAANGADDNQIIVISDNVGYIYDPALGTPFQQIVDADFSAGKGVASLNQIFWVPKADSNTFIGSDTADGLSWTATRTATAEQNPDYVYQPVSLKGAIWWMGAKTCEYWTFDATDTTVPIRPVVGATIQRGVGATESIADFQENVFWLADDFTVWQIQGNSARKISDLSLEYAIHGDGRKAGYGNPETAEGFFIDHPVHKLYVLTFPADNATWIYNLSTGLWHTRESGNLGRWRGRKSATFLNNVLVGDYQDGTIWELSESTFTDGDQSLIYQIVTPPIRSSEANLYITEIQLHMEVGVGTISGLDDFGILKVNTEDPMLTVEYSKDGGLVWKSARNLSFGRVGDREVKLIARKFGRVPRTQSFMLRITVSDQFPVEMYRYIADVEAG